MTPLSRVWEKCCRALQALERSNARMPLRAAKANTARSTTATAAKLAMTSAISALDSGRWRRRESSMLDTGYSAHQQSVIAQLDHVP